MDVEQKMSSLMLSEQAGARDIEGGNRPAAHANTTNGRNDVSIPVVEEELVAGKREVDRGGVRVYSHVTERPVEADVTLREERINVERRPVNRAATAADFEAGQGSMIEMTAKGEESVVGKSSRVVEEVLVGKQTSERNEAIHDTVHKTQVDVEQLQGSGARQDRY